MTALQAWEDGLLRHLAAHVPEARPLALATVELWPLLNDEWVQVGLGEWLRKAVLYSFLTDDSRSAVDWTVGGESTRDARARIAQVWNNKMPHGCTHAAWDDFIAKNGRRPRE